MQPCFEHSNNLFKNEDTTQNLKGSISDGNIPVISMKLKVIFTELNPLSKRSRYTTISLFLYSLRFNLKTQLLIRRNLGHPQWNISSRPIRLRFKCLSTLYTPQSSLTSIPMKSSILYDFFILNSSKKKTTATVSWTQSILLES